MNLSQYQKPNNQQGFLSNPLLIDQCIKNVESLQQNYACQICYMVNTGTVMCSGQCSKYYCLSCVSDWIKTSNTCPSRCSQPFKVKPIPHLNLIFKCPFNSDKCLEEITSITNFNKHYTQCKFINKIQLQIMDKKMNFQCKKGHKLEICKYLIGSSLKQKQIQKCGYCNQTSDSRSFCRICHQFYCLKCRPIPCSKEGCPNGHKFQIQRKKQSNKGRKFQSDKEVCSICGLSLLFTERNYYDAQCMIRVCSVCYSTLPQGNDILFKNTSKALINDYQKCSTCHKGIQYRKKKQQTYQETKCDICERKRICSKKCKSCKKNYCLQCKPIRINRLKHCPNKHLYQKVYNPLILKSKKSKVKDISSQPKNRCCMLCFAEQKWIFQDKGCNIVLCQNCFNQSVHLSYDHHIPLQDLSCSYGHKLEYFNEVIQKDGQQVIVITNQCNICKAQCPSCLQCDVCQSNFDLPEQETSGYCIHCKSIQYSTCYLGHALIPFPIYNICLFCQQPQQKTFSCKQCNFQICWKCRNKSIKKDSTAKYLIFLIISFIFFYLLVSFGM